MEYKEKSSYTLVGCQNDTQWLPEVKLREVKLREVSNITVPVLSLLTNHIKTNTAIIYLD